MPIRGFQSTVDNNLIFGIGENISIDSIEVNWDDGKQTTLYNISSNQTISINKSNANSVNIVDQDYIKLFNEIGDEIISHIHYENNFVDFDRDRLLFHMSSSEGSCICEGDINNDGYPDLYVGGSKAILGRLYMEEKIDLSNTYILFWMKIKNQKILIVFF